jgi:hypothetical protein
MRTQPHRLASIAGRLVAQAGLLSFLLVGPAATSASTLTSHNGWQPSHSIGGFVRVQGVSCADRTFCVAFTITDSVLTWNGNRWSKPISLEKLVDRLGIQSISCARPGACVLVATSSSYVPADAVSVALVLVDGKWSSPTVLTGDLFSVSCLTAIDCIAAGWLPADNDGNLPGAYFPGPTEAGPTGTPMLATFLGGKWTQTPIKQHGVFQQIDCLVTRFCAMTSGNYIYFYSNGSLVQSHTLVDFPSLQIACGSSSLCAAVDPTFETALYTGSRWVVSSPDTNGSFDVVACSSQHCFDGDENGYMVESQRSGWSKPKRVARTAIQTMDCPDPYFCMAITVTGSYVTYDEPQPRHAPAKLV